MKVREDEAARAHQVRGKEKAHSLGPAKVRSKGRAHRQKPDVDEKCREQDVNRGLPRAQWLRGGQKRRGPPAAFPFPRSGRLSSSQNGRGEACSRLFLSSPRSRALLPEGSRIKLEE